MGSPISKVAGTAGGGALGLWRGVGPTLWVDRPAEAATDDGLLTLGGGCGGLKIMLVLLKYGSQEKNPFWCRCSILLGLTFVEIKKSFTETLVTFNSKNFRIICYWKKSDENAAT